MIQFLETASATGAGNLITLVLPMVIVIVFMYLILYLPQRRQEKKDTEMRNSIDVGDEVVTIGGIVGRVAAIGTKDDTFVTQRSTVRVKIRMRRSAISSVNKLDDQLNKDKEKSKDEAKKDSAPLKK